MLSATLNSSTGLLTITGTDMDDSIVVFHDTRTTISVGQKLRHPNPINGVPTYSVLSIWHFNLSEVKAIEVDAGKGDDSVNTGGSARHPLNIPSAINGEDGNDYLAGGNGKDVINGGAGNDRILGRKGDDVLNGGDGNDSINGGQGADVINGDAGNDIMDARDATSTDIIDGGSNDPVAGKNKGDQAFINGDTILGSSVEKVSNTDVVRRITGYKIVFGPQGGSLHDVDARLRELLSA